MFRLRRTVSCALPGLLAAGLCAQTPATPAPSPGTSPSVTEPQDAPPLPKGEILIQSHGEPPSSSPPAQPVPAHGLPDRSPADDAKVDVSDAERTALAITSYDLDARLQPGRAGLTMRARIVVRNRGAAPLQHLPLQISSSLHWESATLMDTRHSAKLALAQHQLDTDADHTGAATEAVLTLPEPLAPGASATLDLFYSGTIAANGDRLAHLGASSSQQGEAEWDGISPAWTGLRGFGNVLWYPVASPQLFLQEGNTLFLAVAQRRHGERGVTVRLRLAVEYTGEPPVAAYFCGKRAPLKAVADDPSVPVAMGTGIASADFAAESLGFRLPSLFVLREQEVLLGGGTAEGAGAAQTSSSLGNALETAPTSPAAPKGPAPAAAPGSGGPLLALVSTDGGIAPGLAQAADAGAGLLIPWLGARPLSLLTVLDHPGQPFQDGPLLVVPAATLETSPERPALVYSLTHAWVQTGQPWIDEGLAQFFALLWVERDHGRPAALAALQELLQPVALAEPNITAKEDTPAGQPLPAAADELFYRRKAAAVWWMLRDLAGDEALSAALTAWRTQPVSADDPNTQALGFEHLLEKRSGKDLAWFFQDWVLRDRGLPDLAIQDVQVSQTPAGAGHSTGWLLAVTVRNEGAAAADVPLIVQSGRLSATARVRVPAFGEVTQRVVAEATPTDVVVNDGSVPELRSWSHTRQLTATPAH